jgi:hypothetical protein
MQPGARKSAGKDEGGRMGWFSKLFQGAPSAPSNKRGVEELARRMEMDVAALGAIEPRYYEQSIPKRSGGRRQLLVPADDLKAVQRTLLRKVLGRLPAHEAVHGFRKGRSIVTNARPHMGRAAVLRMDIQDFFPSTDADRVLRYFQAIDWDPVASGLMARLTTHKGGLPQGAPTSPWLANIVNYQMDQRLASIAKLFDALYTRYADDLTFSFTDGLRAEIAGVIQCVQDALVDYGYKLHTKKKLRLARRHQRMVVTGLVVNEGVRLPRETRRKLRAARHHVATGKPATWTEAQLKGWEAFESMVMAWADGE